MRFHGSNMTFDPVSLKSAGAGTGAAAAAGNTDVSEAFGVARAKAPKYGELSGQAMKNQSMEKQTAMNAEANTVSQGVASFGQAYGQKMASEAQIKSAKIQAEAQKQSAMMGGIGSIASAAFGLFA